MAARTSTTTLAQQEKVRAAIQATQLVKRLQAFALDEPAPNSTEDDPRPVEMDANKLRAIEILLRKSLPDLSSIALSTPDGPLQIEDVKATAKLAAFLSDRKKPG